MCTPLTSGERAASCLLTACFHSAACDDRAAPSFVGAGQKCILRPMNLATKETRCNLIEYNKIFRTTSNPLVADRIVQYGKTADGRGAWFHI